MTTDGIEAIYLETHNWGKAAHFFRALGFDLEFDTGHSSGMLRNGPGPYLFIAEVPDDQPTGIQVVLKVADAAAFTADAAIDVVTPVAQTHHGPLEMTVRDPDGRSWILQAPTANGPEGTRP